MPIVCAATFSSITRSCCTHVNFLRAGWFTAGRVRVVIIIVIIIYIHCGEIVFFDTRTNVFSRNSYKTNTRTLKKYVLETPRRKSVCFVFFYAQLEKSKRLSYVG